MRAAETGRAVLQASVSGISAVIDPDGDVHHETGLFESSDRHRVGADVDGGDALRALRRLGGAARAPIAMLVVTVVAIRRPVTPAVTQTRLDRGDEADHHDQAAQRGRGEPPADGRTQLRADAPIRPR